MFWRFVLGAVKFRRRRLLLAFSGLAVAATLATTLFSVYSDIDRKMHREFRGYGANLVIAPGAPMRRPCLCAPSTKPSAWAPWPRRSSTPWAASAMSASSMAGVDFARAAPLTSYWQVYGARTAGSGECLAGSTAGRAFSRCYRPEHPARIRPVRGSRHCEHRWRRRQPPDGPVRRAPPPTPDFRMPPA